MRPLRRRVRSFASAEEKLDHYSVEVEGGCLDWVGTASGHGYGKISVQGEARYAHRVAYEAYRGQIPPGMVVNHICQRRSCVNPDHLEVITQTENKQFMAAHRPSRGAYFHNASGLWSSSAQVFGKKHSFGYFNTQEEAAEAARLGRERMGMHNPKLQEGND